MRIWDGDNMHSGGAPPGPGPAAPPAPHAVGRRGACRDEFLCGGEGSAAVWRDASFFAYPCGAKPEGGLNDTLERELDHLRT